MIDIIDKICTKCGVPKTHDEFYRHPAGKNGRDSKCKLCAKTAATANRQANLARIRAYDRDRGNRQSTEYLKQWRHDNPEKYKAHNAVNNAVRDGRLDKATECEQCGSDSSIHGHHADYSKPLGVEWLCAVCHTKWRS